MEYTGMHRYTNNIGVLSQAEQDLLLSKHACIVGCGGQGCYMAEMLMRLGVGAITIIDGDTFGESNMNRQLYATIASLGKSKALEAAKRARVVNPTVNVIAIKTFFNRENARLLLPGCDIVLDGLDNPRTKIILEGACEEKKLILIYGSVSGWQAQICTVYPGDRTLSRLYGKDVSDASPGVLSFAPPLAASLQVAAAVKVLLNKPDSLKDTLLCIDLLTGNFELTAT